MLIDEGILECKIAAGLQPDWDAPAVEPGSILVNIGEREAALRELEQAERNLPEPTPHLRYVKGYVLMTLELYSGSTGMPGSGYRRAAGLRPSVRTCCPLRFPVGRQDQGATLCQGRQDARHIQRAQSLGVRGVLIST